MSISAPDLSTRPSVQITFDGLLLFTFEKDNSSCVIGTAKCQKHQLKIIIDGNEVIVSSAKNISISSDRQPGVVGYRPGKVHHSLPNGDPKDLGWLMAIQGDQFHNDPNLLKNLSAIEQRIEVNTGIFYTAMRSSEAIIIAPSGVGVPSTIATRVGCHITLAEGEVLTLEFDGWKQTFTHGDTIRNIEIKYICEEPSSPDHGDFRAFYEIYNTVNDTDKFDVISSEKLQSQRGLKTQNNGPREFCPPIEGEPPI